MIFQIWKGEIYEMKQYSFRKLFFKLLDLGISNSKLASEAGISPASVDRLKHGHVIKLDSLLKICDVLKCNLDDIMEVSPKCEREHTI